MAPTKEERDAQRDQMQADIGKTIAQADGIVGEAEEARAAVDAIYAEHGLTMAELRMINLKSSIAARGDKAGQTGTSGDAPKKKKKRRARTMI